MTNFPSMSSPDRPSNPQRDKLLDLMADQALDHLTAEEDADLTLLRPADPHLEPLEFEKAAAAAHMAFIENSAQNLPTDVRNKLFANAARWSKSKGLKPGRPTRTAAVSSPAAEVREMPRERSGVLARLGWLAAAACLALAVWGWWPWMMNSALLTWRVDHASDRITIAMGKGNHDSGASASGNVVWSDTMHRGYLRLRGLKVNNSSQSQYQLWVKVSNKPDPIDAGVFDVTDATGEITIPINAKLPVTVKPDLFAITVEQSGGVPKSDLERISLVASPTK